MILPLAVMIGLAHTCAPQVAAPTLLSMVRAESGFDPLVIGVNSRPRRALHARTPEAAVAVAQALAAQGKDFDLGLAQINIRTIRRLGLTLDRAVEPCRNLAAGAQVLGRDYLAARRHTSEPQIALRAALSSYNTGDARRGLRNGYVARVERAAAEVVPALAATRSAAAAAAEEPVTPLPASVVASPASRTTALDVFDREPAPELVWTPPLTRGSRPALPPLSPSSGDLS